MHGRDSNHMLSAIGACLLLLLLACSADAQGGELLRFPRPAPPDQPPPPRAVFGKPSGVASAESSHQEAVRPLTTALSLVMPACYVRTEIIDLERAFGVADVDNPRLGLAEEMIRATLAERLIARALLFPTLNAGATIAVHRGALLSARGSLLEVNRESLYTGAGVDVRGGGTVAVPGVRFVAQPAEAILAPRIADQRVLRSRLDAEGVRNNLQMEVARAYLALAGAEARILALRESEKELGEVAKLTTDLAAKGVGRNADAQRARSELALLQSAIERAEEETVAWSTELSRLLSADPSVRLVPEPGMPPLVQLFDDGVVLDALIEKGLGARPEIAARGADVALQELRLRQERVRPFVPLVIAGFSAGNFGGGSDQAGYRFGQVGGRMDFDLVAVWTMQNFGFGNRAAQRVVSAEVGQAEARRFFVVEAVRREIAESHAMTKVARLQMEIARKRVETARKAYQQDLERTKNGVGRVIEVLTSINLLNTARQDFITSMVTYSQSQFQLWAATGDQPAIARPEVRKNS